MARRIWMPSSRLCENKAFCRVLTDCLPRLSCLPLGCAPPGYSMAQSVEDELRFPRPDWIRYWLLVGAQSSSNFNLKLISSEECGSNTSSNSAAQDYADYSDGANGHKAQEVVFARTAGGPAIRSSSGPGALLHLQRSRPPSSGVHGQPFTRSFAGNGKPSDSDQEEKKSGTPCDTQLPGQKDAKLSSFVVTKGDNDSLLQRIEKAIKSKKKEFTNDALLERWEKHVSPQLNSRGIILPNNMNHESTKFIHFRTKEIFGCKPQYMSALDVTGHEIRMEPDEWQQFLLYMMKARIYVIPKWGTSISNVESLMYDFGIIGPDDGSSEEFYKGECDAAFHKDKMEATLSFLILKGTNIIHCQVHYGVPCKSSVMAEAYAAAALLLTSRDMGIKKLVVWTDSKDTKECLSGERNMKLGDEDHLGLFMMLREEMKYFDKVVPVWKPRELNQFADDLVTLDKEITLQADFPQRAMLRWKLQLEGGPIFRFKQKNDIEDIIEDFAYVESYGQAPARSAVFLDVQQVSKLDCLLGLQEGFKPDDLYIAVAEFCKKPQDLQLKMIELFGKPVDISGIPGVKPGATYFRKFSDTRTSFQGDTGTTKREGERKSMMVLFDASLWVKPSHQSQLTVVLMSPGDAESTDTLHLKKMTAMHYVRFRSIK